MCRKKKADLQDSRQTLKNNVLAFDLLKELAKNNVQFVEELASVQTVLSKLLPSGEPQICKLDTKIGKSIVKLRKKITKESARGKYKKSSVLLRAIEISAVERGCINRGLTPCDEADFVLENGVLVRYTGKGGSVVLPTAVEIIGSKAFEGNETITELIVPGPLKMIEDNAFAHCKALSYVSLPETLATVGDSAFYNCSALSTVVFEEGLTNIAHYAFAKCPSLWAVRIPDSVARIGEKAFFLDKNLNGKAKKRIKKLNRNALG